MIGALFPAYVALAPSFSAVYVAVLVGVLFGLLVTIYAGTLDTVDNEHTEMAGAVIVMAIVGAAVVPAIQGYVADMFHSLQLIHGFHAVLCLRWRLLLARKQSARQPAEVAAS